MMRPDGWADFPTPRQAREEERADLWEELKMLGAVAGLFLLAVIVVGLALYGVHLVIR